MRLPFHASQSVRFAIYDRSAQSAAGEQEAAAAYGCTTIYDYACGHQFRQDLDISRNIINQRWTAALAPVNARETGLDASTGPESHQTKSEPMSLQAIIFNHTSFLIRVVQGETENARS